LDCRLNRGRLRFAQARAYMPAMDDQEYWQKQLREAEAELAAARKRAELSAAAARLQRAKAELKRLEVESAERPKRRASRASA
jgi:hypothetical protein